MGLLVVLSTSIALVASLAVPGPINVSGVLGSSGPSSPQNPPEQGPEDLEPTITTIDSSGGLYSSIAIGSDGLGLISYFDPVNLHLKVAHCLNVACSQVTLATVDDSSNVGWYTSIEIGSDGLGLISYVGGTSSSDLKVAHCSDVPCTAAAIATIDSAGAAHTSLAIGSDGLGLISYLDGNRNDLKVAHCMDVSCTAATTATIDDEGGAYT